MTTDQLILGGAVLFFVACLVFAMRGGKAPRLEAFTAPLRLHHPIRSAFDGIEEATKDEACKLLAEEIGRSYAESYRERIKGSLGPGPKASPPAAGSSS